jgi:hypothetical protein
MTAAKNVLLVLTQIHKSLLPVSGLPLLVLPSGIDNPNQCEDTGNTIGSDIDEMPSLVQGRVLNKIGPHSQQSTCTSNGDNVGTTDSSDAGTSGIVKTPSKEKRTTREGT